MANYLVSYDLESPGQKYKAVHDVLRSYPNWAKILESTWIIQTPQTAVQIRDALQRVTDANDKYFVVALNREAAWYGLSEELSKWLKENL